ncbi:MAG TPA: AtpZ/AtpI family protein [Alphaproteobacteria bacterium]|nr:AtpZ/AtpI family protein [Alphaproteobacteria bacterium]USO06238.1 MAG: AtpZ/AtpI family protein [Rhodospirillales bacterium]HOO82458.1 AtpZ/AtpI family protein [Alphaproteobacteria bacterium]
MNSDLKDLEKKIREAKHGKDPDAEELSRIRKAQNSKMAMQAGYEFVASVMLSAILGYFIDQWLGTAPLFLISLFLLGTCAGFLSIFRVSKNLGMGVGYSQLHRDEKDDNKAPNANSNERTEE